MEFNNIHHLPQFQVMHAYRGEATVVEALESIDESVREQFFANYECDFAAACSPDSSVDLAVKNIQRDKAFRHNGCDSIVGPHPFGLPGIGIWRHVLSD